MVMNYGVQYHIMSNTIPCPVPLFMVNTIYLLYIHISTLDKIFSKLHSEIFFSYLFEIFFLFCPENRL